MKLAAVMLARTLVFIETADLNPRGRIFYPDLTRELVKRYNFQVFPQTSEQFDEQKGIDFRAGKIGERVIELLRIFNSLLVVETRSSTTDSKQILEEMLEWGKQILGLNYEPEMLKRWAYVSNLTFYSDVSLMASCSIPLSKLASKTGDIVSEIWHEPVSYEPVILAVGHDPSTRKNQIAAFTIQRRAEFPFVENKYFSEAPLPTDIHIKFLEEFEADVIRQLDQTRKQSKTKTKTPSTP